MDTTIKSELEKALNSTHPLRSVDTQGWCYAGNFNIKDKTYAFIGDLNEGKVTCRCIDTPDYANHWFDMQINWETGKRIITII
jgi:hypothetical protein